jgi:glycosyltransferase involved in cell wall biosynthesis
MSLIIVMPAFDAGRHVVSVIERVLAADPSGRELARIIVVNDGSRDDTRARVSGFARARVPVTLIDRARNGGYGAAMKDGLEAAQSYDPEVVATVHADGQYSPEALPALVQSLRARQLDLLQGSRIAGGGALSGGMPLYKYAANAVLNRLENGTLRLSLSDYHSGYLLYSRRALSELPFRSLSDSFDFDLEVIASACARGMRVGEAPIPTHYGDEVSHLQPIRYGLRVLRVLWNYRRGYYNPAKSAYHDRSPA